MVCKGSLATACTLASSGGRGVDGQRYYQKELSLMIDVGNNKAVTAVDIIDEVESRCGLNTIMACVPKGNDRYEITLSDEESCDLLGGGIELNGKSYSCMEVSTRTLIVSFMHLSSYVSDREIIGKLYSYGVEPVSDIR